SSAPSASAPAPASRTGRWPPPRSRRSPAPNRSTDGRITDGPNMDSKFTIIGERKVHYWEGGSGFPVLMMLGVGPGTSIVGNFGPVLEPLCEHLHVFAMDLIGFGRSDRKPDAPFFDVDL